MPEPVSPAFPLNPGFQYVDTQGKKHDIKECRVRLLPRSERKAIAKASEEEQQDAYLARSIVSLGPLNDQTDIAFALDYLVTVDEDRINAEILKLDAHFRNEQSEQEQIERLRVVRSTDICSKPFNLNPGIVIDGKRATVCIVRLITRGEWKQIQQESDQVRRDDLTLFFAVVQFGNLTSITPAHIDQLTDPDIDRINEQLERLREQYAPGTKS